jgi:hypothetical protein
MFIYIYVYKYIYNYIYLSIYLHTHMRSRASTSGERVAPFRLMTSQRAMLFEQNNQNLASFLFFNFPYQC